MAVKERLVSFVKHLGMGQTAFEEAVGMSRGQIAGMRGGVSGATLGKIAAKYPQLNKDWLLTGVGEMIVIQQAGNKSSHPPSDKDALIAALQATITAKDDLIEELREKILVLEGKENKKADTRERTSPKEKAGRSGR